MIDTAALRALLADTTQGEWFHNFNHTCIDAGISPTINRVVDEPSGMIEEIIANIKFIVTTHNTMPALLDELDRLRAFVVEHGSTYHRNTAAYECMGCGSMDYDVEPAEHEPGCIVAEAVAAQKGV